MSIPLPPMSNTIISIPKQLPILSRHENYRLCFLLIGNKFHIPFDLIRFIYLILSKEKIGTTGKGIGPCYEDKVARRGIRICDLDQLCIMIDYFL